MLNIYKLLFRRVESIFILLIIAFLLSVPGNIQAGDEVEIKGSIQAKSDTSITVNSVELLVTSSTKITSSMNSNLPFDSLKVGSFVKIEAESKTGGTLVASKIRLMTAKINLELNGKITALTTNSLTVKGTQVFVDSNTIIFTQFHAALSFADLKIGDSVLVKATQSIGGQLTAVAIIVKTKNSRKEIELEGKIQALTSSSIKVRDVEFFVDSSTIILSHNKGILLFSDLKVGDDVSVRGFMRQDSTYLALYIRVENEEYERKELEVEGTISAIASNSITVNMITFKVDSGTVIYAHEGIILTLSDLKIGDRVEIKAVLQSDATYKATRIKLENEESKKEIEVEGLIETVNTDNIIVGGLKIFVNNQTKIYNQNKQLLSFSDLKVGTYVKIDAYFQNNNYLAASIKVRDKDKTEINITGSIESINSNSVTVRGIVFITDQNTEFSANNRNQITINDIKVGQIVKIKAVIQNGNQYYALKVKVKDFWRSAIIVEGKIDNLTVNSLTVLGITFFVDSTTVIVGNGTGLINFASLTVGLKVEIKATADSAGKLFAKLIKVHFENEFEIYGKIEAINSTKLVVAGLTIDTDNNTVYYNESDNMVAFSSLKVNQVVEVRYVKSSTGGNLALRIEIEKDPESVVINGVVTAASSNSIQLSVPSFSISGNTVFLNSSYTPVQSSSIQVGQTVTVWASPDQSGNYKADQVQQISGSVTAVHDGGNESVPTVFELKQNYPNPFNPTTNISFTLSKVENVSLTVYNIIGQEVASLVNEQMNAGLHVVTFNAAKLASGIYFYRLQTGDFVAIKKMVLLK